MDQNSQRLRRRHLVKNLYLSIDPFILGLMKNQELDLPSFTLDSVKVLFDEYLFMDLESRKYWIRLIQFQDGRASLGVYLAGRSIALLKDPDQLLRSTTASGAVGQLVGQLQRSQGGFRCWECGEQRKGQNLIAYRKLIRLLARLVVDLCAIFLLWQVYVSHLMNKSAFALMRVDLLKNKFGFDGAFNYKEEQD
ncbi:hypothetical protein SASPL_155811 [Salvia splendens]|uniref:Uncharacterized protein n=1 Tax=Salvia splendens TaxID=180675 RepID=A0A8X8VXU8_SALSN|nr:hypothetical protein SASPL_155811 [Salvia splendens]